MEREIAFITELALASSDRLVFRERLLERLAHVLGFDLGKIQSTSDGFKSFVTCVQGWDVADVEKHTKRYVSELEHRELAAAASGAPMLDTDFVPLARRDRLALYREQMRPHAVTVVATAIWQNERGLHGITLARANGRTFRDRDLRLLARLLPAIKLSEAYHDVLAAPVTGEPYASFQAWARSMGLSERERAVTELVVRGLHNREIAGVLGVSPSTVRNQLASVFRKVDVTTRAELTYVCMGQDAAKLPENDGERASLVGDRTGTLA